MPENNLSLHFFLFVPSFLISKTQMHTLQQQRITKSDFQQMQLSKWPTSMEGFDNGSHPVPTPTLLPFRTVRPHPQIAVLAPHAEFAWDSKLGLMLQEAENTAPR